MLITLSASETEEEWWFLSSPRRHHHKINRHKQQQERKKDSNWMKQISSNTLISKISIPGTHDSASIKLQRPI